MSAPEIPKFLQRMEYLILFVPHELLSPGRALIPLLPCKLKAMLRPTAVRPLRVRWRSGLY